jgi:hypothetical protein
MTGPEHYLQAQQLIASPSDAGIALAQVHATLALAAATAMSGFDHNGMHPDDFRAWDNACGMHLAA